MLERERTKFMMVFISREALLVAQMVKESTCNAWDPRSIPGSGRSPGERNGYPLQYSCLESPLDRGAWRAKVHRVAKSRTWLKWLRHTHISRERETGLGRRAFMCNAYYFFCLPIFLPKSLEQKGKISNPTLTSNSILWLIFTNAFFFKLISRNYVFWRCCQASFFCCWCLVAEFCPTLYDPMDYSLPGSPVHGIFQARILEWVAISFPRTNAFLKSDSCDCQGTREAFA